MGYGAARPPKLENEKLKSVEIAGKVGAEVANSTANLALNSRGAICSSAKTKRSETVASEIARHYIVAMWCLRGQRTSGIPGYKLRRFAAVYILLVPTNIFHVVYTCIDYVVL